MTKNLITGIGGFVASHLADLLLEKEEEVIGTCRWNEDLSRLTNDTKRDCEIVPADLNDLSSLIKVIEKYKPDYIFHLAAQSYVSDSFDYPLETIRINTLGTANLLEAIRLVKDRTIKYPREGIDCIEKIYDPVVHICSSSEVYGLVSEDEVPIKETCKFNPSNPYAVGKVGADMIALMYWTNYGIKTIRTRMFTHTSGRRTMMSAECNFAKQIAEIELELKKPILKHGNLNSIRTWAHAIDACEAYWLLVRKGKPGEVYNIGGSTTKTIGEMLNYMISLSTKKIKLEQDPKLMRPYDVTRQIPDISKFEKEPG